MPSYRSTLRKCGRGNSRKSDREFSLLGQGQRQGSGVSEGKMSAAKLAIPFELWLAKPDVEAREPMAGPQPISGGPRVPALLLAPLFGPPQPPRFFPVPTYAVGGHPEQRGNPPATLNLSLRLCGAGG